MLVLLVGSGIFWFTGLKPSDCTSVEKYDKLTGSCYYDCTSDQDCAAKAKAVDDQLNGFFAGSQTKATKQGDSGSSPTTPTSSDDTKLLTKEFTGSDTNSTIYTVTAQLALAPQPTNDDIKLWNLFSRVVGKDDLLRNIQSFEVFNDDKNDSAASVWQSQTPGKWHVNVNAAYQDDQKDLVHTMVHEYGHILSLNTAQVSGNVGSSCPYLKLEEGCAKQGSYINEFYDRFWKQYGADVPADEGQDQNEVSDFYNSRSSSFVSEYAATNYTEDWAESWAIFVTQPKPTGNQEKDQKVQLFYNHPELVDARNRIRVQIANSL